MGEEDCVEDEPDARFRAVIVVVAAHAPDIEAGRTCILLKRGEVRYFSSIVADAEQPLIGHSVAGNCRYGQRHILKPPFPLSRHDHDVTRGGALLFRYGRGGRLASVSHVNLGSTGGRTRGWDGM